MRKHIFLFMFFFVCIPGMAQTYTWEDFAEDFLLQEEDVISEEERRSMLEDMLDIHQNPFDINTIKKEQLQLLPFLSDQQSDSILSYVRRYGPVLSMNELWLIPRLDKKTRDYLSLFLFCEEKEGTPYQVIPQKVAKLRQQVVGNFNVPLYERQGFKDNSYKGHSFATSIRYRGQWKDRIEWGATLQNDEGEPWMAHGNHAFDYQSGFLSGQGQGVVNKWIIGDYKVKFGMGLIAGHGYWNNMMSLLSFAKNSRQTLFKHASTDEYRFFRGGALVLGNKSWDFTLFCSYRNLDATLKDNGMSTLITSGLHRTASELDKKNNVGAFTTGANMEWHHKNLSAGLSALYATYDKPFVPSSTVYKRYYMTGKSIGNFSLHYNYVKGSLSLQGEGALDDRLHVALLNKIVYSPSYGTKMMLLHRYYDKAYNAPYSFGYSARGYIKNEHGIFAGLNSTVKKKWNIKVAADVSFYPYAIYKATQSSYRTSAYSQIEYAAKKNYSFALRYQLRSYQEDNSSKTKLVNLYKHRWKLQSHYDVGRFKNVSAIDFTYCTTQTDKAETGIMVSQKASVKLKNYTLSAAGAWFNTTSYSSSLYLYEPGPLYSFSFPSCFYHGWRGMVMISGKITHTLNVALKYGITYYTNRKTISSAAQLINHPYKNDLYLQINKKF